MKNLVALIIVLIATTTSTAQVQKIFYVDDVETIEIVTVEFCVNNEAKIDKVTVIPKQTTYFNEETIKKLKEYLLTIQYYPDSKLRNNCYPSTFEFVNYKYQNASIPESQSHKCLKFKKGKYEYLDLRYANTKIKRTNKKQVEVNDHFKAKYKITWPSPCEYNMTYYMVREEENKHLLGKTIYVKIIGVLENSYIYTAIIEDQPQSIGEIKKL